MPTIEITRRDLSISRLRAEAARTADGKQARRILALAVGLYGRSRLGGGACARGMDRQTPARRGASRQRRWLGGACGPAPAIASAASGQNLQSEVAKWVEDGPDPKTDGVVRWRCAGPRDRIAAKINIHLHPPIFDGAGWHGSPQAAVPENIVLLPPPPCAAELNPAENIWE